MGDTDIKIVGLSNSKAKGKTNWKVIGAIVGIVVLALGVVAGIILVRQQQNVAEKAATTANCVQQCPGPGKVVLRDCVHPEPDGSSTDSKCIKASGVSNTKVMCGGKCFKCDVSSSQPGKAGVWVSVDKSECAKTTATTKATSKATATAAATTQATVVATSTTFATATSTVRSTSTAMATATATATETSIATDDPTVVDPTAAATVKATTTAKSKATTAPIPVTGVEWPTVLGAGFGVIMILVSLTLVF